MVEPAMMMENCHGVGLEYANIDFQRLLSTLLKTAAVVTVDYKPHQIHLDGFDCKKWNPWSEFIINHEHKLIYCALPKVACTEWKRFMKRLGGHSNYLTVDSKLIHNPIKSQLQFLDCDRDKVNSFFSNGLPGWTVAATVRHPISRIFSAYLDRCLQMNEWGRCLTQSRSSFMEVLEFFQQVKLQSLDIHFRPQSFFCGFGSLSYDIVGRYEQLANDTENILRTAGLWEDFGSHGWPGGKFLATQSSSSNHMGSHEMYDICKFLSNRSLTVLEALSRPDLDAFGYSSESISDECQMKWGQDLKFYIFSHDELHKMNQNVLTCYKKSFGQDIWFDERTDKAQDSAEVWLHRAFMESDGLVENPLDADIIFLPFYFKTNFEVRTESCGDNMTSQERLESLDRILMSDEHFIARPSRFIFVCQFWQCSAAIKNVPSLGIHLKKSIMLIHEKNKKWSAGQEDNRQILVPYVANSYITSRQSVASRKISERSIKLFARLSERRSNIRTILKKLSWNERDAIVQIGSYSVVNKNKYQQPNLTMEYGEMMFDSKFCLHVSGDTPTSRRLYDSIAAGCIPVIVAENIRVNLPFRESIPWDSFSIFIEPAKVRKHGIDAFDIVWKLQDEDANKMQNSLFQYRNKLIYGHGDPFNMTSDQFRTYGIANEILKCFKKVVLFD
eukprot:jgi/Picsp_1/4046/NSC_01557-R1_protein